MAYFSYRTIALIFLGGFRRCSSFQTSRTFAVRVTATVTPSIMNPRYGISSAIAASSTSTSTSTSGVQDDQNNAHLKDEGTMSTLLSFVSNPAQLYIEDTDAYGVMYNGNYIKSYERALHEFHTRTKCEKIAETKTDTDTDTVLNHSDFYLTQCTAHKFKSSPALGSRYVIRGHRVEVDSVSDSPADNENGGTKKETWSLAMEEYVDVYGNEDQDENDDDDNQARKIYNTATVTIASPHPNPQQHQNDNKNSEPMIMPQIKLASLDAEEIASGKPVHSQRFIVHRDEFDHHMKGSIPIATTLNLFERVRSDSLGGPDQLRRMQEEDNILWVVTSIDNLQIDTTDNIQPGDEVVVRMYATIKRRGMIIVCDQDIVIEDDSGKLVVLAKGTVTICALNSKSGRPTNKIPEHVRKLF